MKVMADSVRAMSTWEPRPVPIQPLETGDGGDGCVAAGNGIGDKGAGAVRALVAGVSGGGGKPARSFDIRAVGDPVAPRARRAESADGDHHELRVNLAQLLIRETEVGHDARAVILG